MLRSPVSEGVQDGCDGIPDAALLHFGLPAACPLRLMLRPSLPQRPRTERTQEGLQARGKEGAGFCPSFFSFFVGHLE